MKFLRKKQKPETDIRRTPVQGSRPAVFSYYARGSSPGGDQNTGRNEQAKGRADKSRLRLASLPSYIALIVAVIAVVYTCMLQPNPRISVADKPGTIYRPVADYQNAINAMWQSSVFNRSKLTIRSEQLQRDIKSQFNEIESVKIELPLLGQRPKVALVPAKPAMHFVSSNGSFYVNYQGKVLSRTTDVIQNQTDLPLVLDESRIPADPGKPIISETEATFLQKLAGHLKAENIAYESIVLPATAAKEADVRLPGQKYHLKFSMLTDPRQAVGSYLAIRDKLAKQNITPSEYIDLRTDEKVFYK